MQLILARRRGHAESWCKDNGIRLARDHRRRRSDSTVYVSSPDQLRGSTLTSADTIIVLDEFERRANAALIEESIRIASLADPAGGPTWETR